ncbi:thymopoietin a isoform X3 [Nerophis lumbriciformis]|uniref:thymopoietin a isoform X3 n=1 Tax=Nerophis lumbriciformis TaxID=546530 RepID=UPI002AE070F7|nr:lamina-associated polypeptide 2, isoforms beta/gamma-like isoform X3 [Nerophis lumbriciformis]
MPFVDDPSVFTKDKLKSELLAHNVELPSGNQAKDVYVQLYLKNLTAQNKKHVAAITSDAFSSDEELPPPVVSNRSRSSGKKAPRKTEKVPVELDVTTLTDEDLREELIKHGVHAGPIVASTRQLYEKKLQKLLNGGSAQEGITKIVVTEIQITHNGNSESELYSDKEDDVIVEEPEPEPVPVVEKPVRSRGKTPITTRTRSSQYKTPKALPEEQIPQPAAKQSRASPPWICYTKIDPVTFSPMRNVSPIKKQESHWSVLEQFGSKPSSGKAAVACDPPDDLTYIRRPQEITNLMSTRSLEKRSCALPLSNEMLVRQVEKIAASDQTPKVDEKDVLKELFPNDINSSLGFTATCRRPIRGAAGRPVTSRDLLNDENSYFSSKTAQILSNSTSSSYTENRIINRVSSVPTFSPNLLPSTTKLLSAMPPAAPTKVARPGMALWKKMLLLVIGAAFLFFVYQAMETNSINPFSAESSEVVSGSKA